MNVKTHAVAFALGATATTAVYNWALGRLIKSSNDELAAKRARHRATKSVKSHTTVVRSDFDRHADEALAIAASS